MYLYNTNENIISQVIMTNFFLSLFLFSATCYFLFSPYQYHIIDNQTIKYTHITLLLISISPLCFLFNISGLYIYFFSFFFLRLK